MKHEPIAGRRYALIEGCKVDGIELDECFIVAGKVTERNGFKDWDPRLYSMHQGSSGMVSYEKKTPMHAITPGNATYDWSVWGPDFKWKPYMPPKFTAIFGPEAKHKLQFLGYVRQDVDISREGKF